MSGCFSIPLVADLRALLLTVRLSHAETEFDGL